MSQITLYQLSGQFSSLLALQDSDELPPDAIRDTLDALEGDFEAKAVAVAHVVENLAAMADVIKAKAKLQLERAARMQARSDSLKAYLQFHMQAVGKEKIEHEDFDIRLQDNPPAVVIEDEAAIPDTYKIQPETPPKCVDKQHVARDLKAGVAVAGARLDRGQHVRITA